MGKARMLGKTSGFIPNSQADRRRVNRTFLHREYQKGVQLKKKIELDAAIADLDKMAQYASTSWEELLEAMEALSSAVQEEAQESAEKIKEAYEILCKAIGEVQL